MTFVVEWLHKLVEANKKGRSVVDGMIEAAMWDAGCTVQRFRYDPGSVPLIDEFAADENRDTDEQEILVGRLAGTGGGKSMLLFAHPDTEPVERAEGWATDPFTAKEMGWRLHGWGVADDLAGIAMLVGSIAEFRERRPSGDITLVSAPSKRHRRGIAAALHKGVGADAALYLHPAESGRGLNDIKAFAPGQLEFEIIIEGHPPETEEPAHTAFAHQAVNPLDLAIKIIEALNIYGKYRGDCVEHPLPQAAIERSSNLMFTQCHYGDPLKPLHIAPICKLRAAMTLIPGENMAELQGEIEENVRKTASENAMFKDVVPKINWLAGVAAAETPTDSELYHLTENMLRRAGNTPKLNPLHTSSDIRNPMVQKNIPTVGYGPLCGNIASNGHTDEWVDIQDLIKATDLTSRIVTNWCG